MPSMLGTIFTFLGHLAAKITGKAIDTKVEEILTTKQRKKDKEQHDDIQQSIHRVEGLLSERLGSEDSQQIRTVAAKLKPLIETLHVRTAHDILDDLRKTIPATDRKTLSRIDYYRACCSRYVNRQRTIDEINSAYQEMLDYGSYDPDIVAAKIFVHCISNNASAAQLAASRLKTIDRNNVWSWVPDILFSGDLTKAYSDLPVDVDTFLILSTSCLIGNNTNSLGVDIETFEVIIPDNLTFENIPLWTFNLSVLINRFLHEWNHSSQHPEELAGDATRQLYAATSKLLSLQSKTELTEIVSDLVFWNAFSGCQINPTDEQLNTLKTCTCREDLNEYRVIAYASVLFNQKRYEEAKQYLSQTIITPAVLNQRFRLSLQSADPDYAVETFKLADANQVSFPSQLIIYALSAIKYFPDQVSPYADKLILESQDDSKVYMQICQFYRGERPDTQYLMDNQSQISPPFLPFVALILHAEGNVDEGIELLRKCLPKDTVDMVSCMYVDLLENTPSHTAELYEYLRRVREDLGFVLIPRWLRLEYSLALRLSDFPRMLAVAKILHEIDPADSQCFICYLQSLVRSDEKDTIRTLIEELPQYSFTPSHAHAVYAQLVLAGYPRPALEVLYDACIKNPTNEELSLTFFHAAVNPSTSAIINEEGDSVINGSYIHYTVNGETKSTIVDESNRLAFLIGHKSGDTILQTDWRGNSEKYVIDSIHNKYFQLSERIHQDIADNKYNSVKAIKYTDDELKSGKIIEELPRIAGQDKDYHARRLATLHQYKEGNMSLAAFIHDENLVSDLYNHLFGEFKVYGFTTADFDSLYKAQQSSIGDLQPVMDFPSLILFYELQRKFNVSINRKIIIPRIIVNELEISLQNEMHGSPSGVYQSITEILDPAESNESWLVSRIKAFLMWIKENAQIEDTTERLNQDPTVFKQSLYITLCYDCYSLVKPGRVLVSTDKMLVRVFAASKPVADVNYLFHDNEQYPMISRFFMEANIYGGDLEADFVFGEYVKYVSGKPSLFLQCKENLAYCPSLVNTTIQVCERISKMPIVSPADILVIEELLRSLFRSLDRKRSLSLLQEIVKNNTTALVRFEAREAFKSVYPIVQ